MSGFVYRSSETTPQRKDSQMSRSRRTFTGRLLVIFPVTLLLLGLIYLVNQSCSPVEAADSQGVDLQELRQELLASADTQHGNWLRTLNPLVKRVEGDLVWNSPRQTGVMKISKLPRPKAGSYYQLWIFDTRKSTMNAISGAVFRYGSGRNELFIPIETNTHVESPYKFELNLEFDDPQKASQILLMVQP